ncbi:MAG: ORF6N domain-containing protein [Romboutsia timonensis]
MNEISIANTNITIKEYQGQRVVTFKDIDTIHQRPDGTARRNFNTNKKHFIEGEDYFVRNSYEAKKEYGIIAPNGVVLVAESGYLMLVKSFTDDISWDIQRELVKTYFRVKSETTVPTVPVHQPEYQYIDKTYHAQPVMTIADISHIFELSSMTLYSFIVSRLTVGTDYLLLHDDTLKEYLEENPTAPRCRKSLYVISHSGLRQVIDYFDLDVKKVPKAITETRGYVVQADVRRVMEYVRKEIKGIEALTYLVESNDTPSNLERYRMVLAKKLSSLRWWQMDVETIKLGIHNITSYEMKQIHFGQLGLKY